MGQLNKLWNVFEHKAKHRNEDFIVSDGKGTFKLTPEQQEDYVVAEMQAFMHNKAQVKNDKVEIQAFMGSTDLPQLTKDVFNVTQATPYYDLGWQRAFRTIQLLDGQLNWEIATTSSPAAFTLIPEFGKVAYEEFTGSKVIVGVDKYSMAIGITWETIVGRKLYQFIDQMEDARAKLFRLWADAHYGALQTAAATNAVAWGGVATDEDLDRDIQTLNDGYTTIAAATKDKGYGDTANAEMLLYIPLDMKARVLRAIEAVNMNNKASSGAGSAAGQRVSFNITPITTQNSSILSTKGVMVLPGQKIQNAVKIRELALSEMDIQSLNQLRTYWTAFGLTVADTDQTAELSFS